MIAPELRACIRRLYFAEHWKIGTIAGELRVHHDTVRAAVEADRFVRTGTQVRPSVLDPYTGRRSSSTSATLGHAVMSAAIRLREEDFPTAFLKTAA